MLSFDHFHDDEADALRFDDVENRGDVRVIEGGGGAGLLDESSLALGVDNELRRENFDSDLTLKLGVERFVDDAHTAATDLFEYLVVSERASDQSRAPMREYVSMSGGYVLLGDRV